MKGFFIYESTTKSTCSIYQKIQTHDAINFFNILTGI